MVEGGITITKDFVGQMVVQVGSEAFSMDRLPAEIFDKLAAGVLTYRSLDADDQHTDRTEAEQATSDLLSE